MKKVYAQITLRVTFVVDENVDIQEVIHDMDHRVYLEDRDADILDVSVEDTHVLDVK